MIKQSVNDQFDWLFPVDEGLMMIADSIQKSVQCYSDNIFYKHLVLFIPLRQNLDQKYFYPFPTLNFMCNRHFNQCLEENEIKILKIYKIKVCYDF